jgi:hypothetical protein
MAVKLINVVTQVVGGTKAAWDNTTQPIPDKVLAIEMDTGDVKRGDGEKLYSQLPVLFNINEFIQHMQTLNSKAPIDHEHTTSAIRDLTTILEGKANTSHAHSVGQINGLAEALDRLVSIDGYNADKLDLESRFVTIIKNAKDLVRTPEIVSPVGGETGVLRTPTITTTAYGSMYGVAHGNAEFEISETATFDIIAASSGTLGGVTEWVVSETLAQDTQYYVRARHRDTDSIWSKWSDPIPFTTGNVAISTPSVTSPDNGDIGVSQNPTLTTSAFSIVGSLGTHLKTDWQIATDSGFANIVIQSLNDTTHTTSWTIPTGTLSIGTQYFVRVRYHSSDGEISSWSATTNFTTLTISVITPSIISPGAGSLNVSLTPTLSGSAFSMTGSVATHLKTDWQIASDATFTNIVSQSANDALNKTSWTSSVQLTIGTTYYARVRYYSTDVHTSAWSAAVSFITVPVSVATPSITSPTNGAIGQSPALTLTASAFSIDGSSGIHDSTDWQISPNSTFSTITLSQTATTTNKTNWPINQAGLNDSVTYYARVRYASNDGFVSNWSPTISFTVTAPSGSQLITVTSNFIPPAGVFSVCAVAVGEGGAIVTSTPNDYSSGAGGGGLRFKNNIPCTPGTPIPVTINTNNGVGDGGSVSFGTHITAYGGKAGAISGPFTSAPGGLGGSGVGGDGGGVGGNGGSSGNSCGGGGGGGAGGYNGNGGNGGPGLPTNGSAWSTTGGGGPDAATIARYDSAAGTDGSGGGGGGGSGAAQGQGGVGGNIGLNGLGTNGGRGYGLNNNGSSLRDGFGGGNGSSWVGGNYGRGAGGCGNNGYHDGFHLGRPGAIRVIWGPNRSFPSSV